MATLTRNITSEPPGTPAVVIPFPGRPADPQELRDAYDRYRAVTGNVAPDAVTTAEVAAARAALTRLLVSDGWEPPRAVLERLQLDDQLLGQSVLSAS